MKTLLSRRFGPFPAVDLALALVVFAMAAGLTFRAADWKREQYIWAARDVWFDADAARVVRIEADDPESYSRTMMHPLYPFIAAPPIWVVKKLGASADFGVRAFHAGMGGIWVSFFFLLLRRFGLRRPDAALFTGLLSSSAAAIFWLPVPEGFVTGGVAMYPTLALAAGAGAPFWTWVAATLVPLGVTLTNVMAPVTACLAVEAPRRAIRVTAVAVAAAGLVMVAHKMIFVGSNVLPPYPGEEFSWIYAVTSGGPIACLRVFFVGSMVAPEVRFETNWLRDLLPWLTFQFGGLGSGGTWARIATPLWLFLLAAGAAAMRRLRTASRVPAVLTAVILCQLLLHILYGRETFLYAPHYLPMLVAVAAFSTFTRLRPLILALTVLLIAANLLNNVPTFEWCKNYTRRNAHQNELARRGLIHPKSVEFDPQLYYRFWKDLQFSAGGDR